MWWALVYGEDKDFKVHDSNDKVGGGDDSNGDEDDQLSSRSSAHTAQCVPVNVLLGGPTADVHTRYTILKI